MKHNTPLFTLLTGIALGVVLLIVSIVETPSKATSVGYAATAPTAPASTTPASSAPASTAPASTAPASTAPASTAPAYSAPASTAPPSTGATVPSSTSPTTATTSVPVQANYAGDVKGSHAAVAISVDGNAAVGYVCNGSHIDAWVKGTVSGGHLVMTGKNHARFDVSYNAAGVTGGVVAHKTHYSFSAPIASKSAGLYQTTAVVHGVKIKAGWIVMSDGTQIGSLEPDADSATPSAIQAPILDVAAGTAEYEGVVLHAIRISGMTGRGF